MNIGLKVNVIHVVCEEDIDQQEFGVELNLSGKTIEEYTLYTIDYTKRFNNKIGIVSSAGLDFIVNESYESLNRRIAERQTFRFN